MIGAELTGVSRSTLKSFNAADNKRMIHDCKAAIFVVRQVRGVRETVCVVLTCVLAV